MVHLISGRIGIKRADNYVPDFWAAAWCRAMMVVEDDPIGQEIVAVGVRERKGASAPTCQTRRGEIDQHVRLGPFAQDVRLVPDSLLRHLLGLTAK